MFVLCFQCKLHLRADVSILVEEAIALSVTLSGGTLFAVENSNSRQV